jgi:hypothetical protein
MSLTPPTPGLRRIHNKSKHVAKVAVIVQPGDELEVSGDVALQLVAQTPAFGDGPAPKPAPEVEPVAEVKPAKKAAAKKAAAKTTED